MAAEPTAHTHSLAQTLSPQKEIMVTYSLKLGGASGQGPGPGPADCSYLSFPHLAEEMAQV